MSKKQDVVKLGFFSDSIIESLENQITAVIKLYQSGRLSYRNAQQRLHAGKDDALTIYWHISGQLATAQQELRTIAHYQEINGKRTDLQLHCDSQKSQEKPLYPNSSNPIINQLMEGFQDYQDGKIDFQQWEAVAMKCHAQLKSENRSIRNEVRDILRKSKEYSKGKQDEMIRVCKELNAELDQVSDEDMAIKKIKP